MKKILILLIVGFICCANECKKPCEDTDTDEINFDFVPYGTKAEITDYYSGAIITSQVYSDVKLKVSVRKCYCDGNSKGPFDDMYEITSKGDLDKLSLGTMGYRMDNERDYMHVSVSALSTGGSTTLNDHSVNYSELKRYDEGTFNLELRVAMKYDVGKKIVQYGNVTYVHH